MEIYVFVDFSSVRDISQNLLCHIYERAHIDEIKATRRRLRHVRRSSIEDKVEDQHIELKQRADKSHIIPMKSHVEGVESVFGFTETCMHSKYVKYNDTWVSKEKQGRDVLSISSEEERGDPKSSV